MTDELEEYWSIEVHDTEGRTVLFLPYVTHEQVEAVTARALKHHTVGGLVTFRPTGALSMDTDEARQATYVLAMARAFGE